MAKPLKEKRVLFTIRTTEAFLEAKGLSLEDVQEAALLLGRAFGTRYKGFFPTEIYSEHIAKVVHVASLLKEVEDLPGFKRHIRAYDKHSMQDHLFTAKTAAWLKGCGLSVEFEPVTPEGVRNPDLKVERDGDPAVFVECKRIDTEKFFDLAAKQDLADLIYDKLPTCDQLTFYLAHDGSAGSIRRRVSDKAFATIVFKTGMMSEEAVIEVEGQFRLRVMRKPTIIGGEDDFLTLTAGGWLQDVKSGVRLPGYAFMRGGRSIGVYGPPPDYRGIWNRKRHKSKHQAVPGHPFVTIILDEDVLGDPAEHERFFKEVWLTSGNEAVSGIGFLSFAQMPGAPQSPMLDYAVNPDAAYPLSAKFFDAKPDT